MVQKMCFLISLFIALIDVSEGSRDLQMILIRRGIALPKDNPERTIAAPGCNHSLHYCGNCSGDVQLISNGDFSSPILMQNWNNFGQSIKGWSSKSSNGIEVWREGAIGSPILGSKGQKTGQHLELSGNSPNGKITTEFQTTFSGEATLSFEFWSRPDWHVVAFGFVLKKGNQVILDIDLSDQLNSSKWVLYSTQVPTLEKDAQYQLTFQEDSVSTGGTHINDVSLIQHCLPSQDLQELVCGIVYKLQEGDTIYTIAASLGINTQDILEANPTILDPQRLAIHQSINIPPCYS
eukprot:TRINITY_DN19399_c0_g1_i1.p1 TRINITY_DN19399_c0_g1~~TRINITY_DN19399_c0_g1_i1.p1  ORF type:complete len:293 (+),score=33.79 TRINITY_DN19399_c0_g1_i1:116-994(+)